MTEQTMETPDAPEAHPTDPAPADPARAEAAPADPAPADPARAEAAPADPAPADPAPADPAPADPAPADPAPTDPARAEAAPTDPAPAEAPVPQTPEPPLSPPSPFPSLPPKPPRRVLRAVARWTAAVLVCGGFGAGAAAGITSMERTDVPGLATESDGRWDYPELSLPALPAGSPRPYSDGNVAEIHHADLRSLLLPAPAGATVDKKLDGGWVSTEQYLSEYVKGKRSDITQTLKDFAPRHVAARGWTMPDGTSTRIYLVRFNSTAFAQGFMDSIVGRSGSGVPLVGAPETVLDEGWSGYGKVNGTTSYVYDEAKPYGEAQVRHGYLVAGDTLALVVQARRGREGTESVPFHQTLILQNQLLG
ncbi:hypothetical protein OG508_18535 [Streptomyces sp. NBC_01108]|uniref:hypothetical protein n=1 Tax=unclassified Streptomyces TaxID=2593676 RepID=UPI00352D9D94|nr:hypothetical protein OG306_20705 [Streptomyces sp. NBC_01241]WSU22770.1 hypothetical protein OG508_18535 [Streptomyces sp. NBC_01108]